MVHPQQEKVQDDPPKRNFSRVFGIEIKGPRWFVFMVCCAGVAGGGIAHDFIQESVYRTPGYDYGWFMTLCELVVFVMVARIELALLGTPEENNFRGVPWSQYTMLTVVLAATQGCGSAALSYVNMPVKVVMKSSKLIPTMALGLLIIRRGYSGLEYAAAVMLCAGTALFVLSDANVSPDFNPIGIVLLSVAVCGDALTVNMQDKLLNLLKCSKEQMLVVSNLMASAWVLVYILGTGELSRAVSHARSHPGVPLLLAVQSVAQYVGVSFYLALIQGFGGVAAVCVTSCRKVVTIALSFAAFSKPFTVRYVPTGLLVVSGIVLSVLAKQPQKAYAREKHLTLALGVALFVWSVEDYVWL